MLDLSLKYLDWDSEQLGVRCGLIDGTRMEVLPRVEVLSGRISKLIRGKKYIEFITIKLPENCIETVNSLVRIGASLIDTELTFHFPEGTQKAFNAISNNYRLEFCREVDCRPFLPLAKDMRLSRFFLDSKISVHKAIHLWETSIKNHCKGFADQLLVAYFNNEPCGIVTLKFEDSNRLFLHIVGVLKRYQGKKIGKLMLNTIIGRYATDYSIYVETQSINIPAQTIYQKAGFRYHTLKYVLHYWRDQKKD